jgi:diguanylate cyclase (GGDEF)-like protein
MPIQSTKNTESCLVLIVDDGHISATLISSILNKVCRCFTALSAADAIKFCENQLPDLLVVDVNMPGTNGLELCRQLKARQDTANIPLIFITAELGEDAQVSCWQAGGNDFVTKPIVAQTIVHRVRNHLLSKLRLDAVIKLSFEDSLTGLYNRNYLNEEYPRLSRQLMRDHQPLGLIIFDVDYFKQYNDTYGHLKGDMCLENVATVLKGYTRRARDAVVRYGGEEFILLLPNTGLSGTRDIANQILTDIYNLNMAHKHSPFDRVTLSAGAVSVQNMDRYTLNDVIEQADINLYDAKLKGKNKVISG